MDPELKGTITQATDTAEEFTKLYYESVDKRRHLVDKLYLDTGLFVWNGNNNAGKDSIKKFYEGLPPTEHTMQTLDSQPIVDKAVSGQLTLLIQVGGMVKYESKQTRPFQQTFMITAQGDKWKIASDCFRLQEDLR